MAYKVFTRCSATANLRDTVLTDRSCERQTGCDVLLSYGTL